MEKSSQTLWLKKIVDFIGEYARTNSGYSRQELAENLADQFSICLADAEKLALRVEQELATHKPGLAAMELNLTFNCNLACAYCFVHDKSPGDRMNIATAQKAVDLLFARAAYPSVNITLFGGEPLLEFDLIKKIVPYALDKAEKCGKNVTWAITSNGTLLNEGMLQFFAEYQIFILLSLDGGSETHDRYRRTKAGEGTWKTIVNLIPLLKRYQPWLGTRMTVSTEAVSSMRQDFQQLVELGLNQFIFAPAQGAGCWSEEQIEQYGLNLVQIFQDYRELKSRGVNIFIEEFERDANEYKGWGCKAGVTSLAVAPNGDVSPCSKLLGLTDQAGKYIIGNVNSAINDELLEPFQKPISRQPQYCIQCSHKCTGGCYAVNFEQTGDHFTPSKENCLFWAVKQEISRLSKS